MRLQRISPTPSYLKNWHAIHHSFATITKASNNKTAETFRERLKLMDNFPEIDGRKDS